MRPLPKFLLLAVAPAVMLAFQNCSKHEFNTVDASVASQGVGGPGGPGGNPGGPNNPPIDPNIPVVCDPFSGGSCAPESGSGLAGEIYSYPKGVGVQNYIDKGTRIHALVILNDVNVPIRSFDRGFPTTSGGILKDESQKDLVEYFALDLRGYITMNAQNIAGKYQFALMSDDGSILDIDGKKIVDNDGTHSAQWKCADTAVDLQNGVAHAVRLRYYQGPAHEIAVQLLWRPWSERAKACDSSGGWKVVPANVLSH